MWHLCDKLWSYRKTTTSYRTESRTHLYWAVYTFPSRWSNVSASTSEEFIICGTLRQLPSSFCSFFTHFTCWRHADHQAMLLSTINILFQDIKSYEFRLKLKKSKTCGLDFHFKSSYTTFNLETIPSRNLKNLIQQPSDIFRKYQ